MLRGDSDVEVAGRISFRQPLPAKLLQAVLARKIAAPDTDKS
jgi:hypothetical protein